MLDLEWGTLMLVDMINSLNLGLFGCVGKNLRGTYLVHIKIES